jgi:lysyl-tRNA synthetase class 1
MSKNQPWPAKEATALARHMDALPGDGPVVFETGFGPSGLPHIGTFAEVARTTFIRRAFEQISDRPTILIAFSDDTDGLRKVPLNIPNKDLVTPHLGKPLCDIPDPFEVDESFSAHMNRRLREFLDSFRFDYDFRSSAQMYRQGVFDETLHLLLQRHDAVLDIILPTLRPASREGWSAFMVVCESCGRNLTTTTTEYHPESDELSYRCDGSRSKGLPSCGHHGRTTILGGRVKVGWKVDWALRWFTFGVNYEMYGKDLIESAQISARIVRALGGTPPIGLFYEMFLDEDGKKISKSIGKGISVDRWKSYAPIESLLAFLYQNPRKAKRLEYKTIPRFTDQFLKELGAWSDQSAEDRIWNPSFFYFNNESERPRWDVPISYSLVRNMVACMGEDDPAVVMEYLRRYDERVSDPDHAPLAEALIRGSMAFDAEFEAPHRTKSPPSAAIAPVIAQLADALLSHQNLDAEEVQGLVFSIARSNDLEPKALFQALYRGLIGQNRGPRFGGFTLAMGVERMAETLKKLAASPAPETD